MGYRHPMVAVLVAFLVATVLVVVIMRIDSARSRRAAARLGQWLHAHGWTRPPRGRGIRWNAMVPHAFEKICVDLTPCLPPVSMALFDKGLRREASPWVSVLVIKPGVALPEVAILRKRWLTRGDGTIGSSERALYFDDPAFQKSFTVRAPEPDQGYRILGPAMRALLLAHTHIDVDIRGQEALFTLVGQASPARFEALLAFAKAFFERLPSDLLAGATPRPG